EDFFGEEDPPRIMQEEPMPTICQMGFSMIHKFVGCHIICYITTKPPRRTDCMIVGMCHSVSPISLKNIYLQAVLRDTPGNGNYQTFISFAGFSCVPVHRALPSSQ